MRVIRALTVWLRKQSQRRRRPKSADHSKVACLFQPSNLHKLQWSDIMAASKMPTDDTHTFSDRIPDGDDHIRKVCDTCGFIAYENPKLVAGAVVSHDDRILLCRRAIEPRRGFWTLPAGYMELNETTADAARREAQEEARADICINALLAVYSIPRISQVQIIYRATLEKPAFSAGPESLEVGLFAWDQIPWNDIAFPSVHWALNHYQEARGRDVFAPFSNPSGETGNMSRQGEADPAGI